MRNLERAAVLLLGMLMLPGSVIAQKLYRCGNQYQDTPCAAGQPEKRLSVGTRRDPGVAAGAVDASCSSLGERALKVIWSREAGATAEDQLAGLPNTGEGNEQRKIVSSVYQKRGSAPSIRAAIEAECREEKARRRQAQELAAAAAQLSEPDDLVHAPTPQTTSSPIVSPPGGVPSDLEAQRRAAEEQRIALCNGWKSDLAQVRSQQRAGGNPSSMEKLNGRKRALERSLSDQGC